MTALTSDRVTRELRGGLHYGPAAAAVTIFAGALLCRDAAGNLTPGATAAGLTGVGRAAEQVDNRDGAAGDVIVRFEPGTFGFGNSAGADEVTAADIGKVCFVVDDQTVAKTDGGGTRSPAGIVHSVEGEVFVRFDEALTRAT